MNKLSGTNFARVPTDPLAEHLHGLKDFAETYTESALHRERSAAKLRGIMRKADLIADTEITKAHEAVSDSAARGLGKNLDCTAGCSSCCYRSVKGSAPEAIAIWAYIEEVFTKEERQELVDRLHLYTESVKPGPASRAACPLLKNELCSIYPVRPLECRGRNSFEVAACIEDKEHPEKQVRIPSIMAQDAIASFVSAGIRLGLHFQFTDPRLVDIGTALALMAGGSAGADTFLMGGKAFEGAIREDDNLTPGHFAEHEPTFQSEESQREPTGMVAYTDFVSLKDFRELWYNEADYKSAFAKLARNTAAHGMMRINVPRVYRSTDELLEWRERFVISMREYSSSSYAPSQGFNALSLHETLPLAYQGKNDKDILAEHGRIVVEEIVQPCFPDLVEPISRRSSDGKFRIGYLSANMKNSNGCRWALGWLKNHGKAFETYALNVGPTQDFVTKQFKDEADHYFHLVRNVAENARFIKSLALDAIIFTDIGLTGRNLQYASMRLAAVQCTAWGHPETSGLPTIDYYLSSDLMEADGAEEHYTEKLVRLPGTGLCYPRITTPVADLSRKDLGLPDGILYMVPHTVTTCIPEHDSLYAQVCQRSGRPIVFIESTYAGETSVTKERMKKAGVDALWVKHMARGEYLRFLQLCDVALDTPSWSGGNTSIECLHYGKPVVALPGELMRGRHTLAFLQVANAPALVAADAVDFVELACDFGRQQQAMKSLNAEALFEDTECVQALDQFLWNTVR
jgi:predicted O-linked N-acetylglucosamine transferase (SPINDLY family)/Fe-S-cluster containining protein